MDEESKKKWFEGRDSHSGLRLRNIELELEGEKTARIFQAWRIWQREGQHGFQLTNLRREGLPEKWKWFNSSRIVSLTVEPVPEGCRIE